MAPIGAKLCQNACQTIPHVSFLDEKKINLFANFERTFTPEDGSDWLETLPKRVSGDSGRFIFRHRKQFFFESFANFENPFTPRGWLRLT